ncbi:hypothetical protein [Acanthopleuribacter pedis]|uniref:Uncharacterized protein n=1 Tax=Acanthopleuribacter pedis TaxID=442870 RepID=A0A8J7Q9X4_9BACT|nr:hypothetical protein [Acanthopleuribacter pedis]MBO1321436.1 hypothetical protein [Acanthopleuribacter pedis]
MTLRDFFNTYNINEDALVRMKRRLFVVGRFNQKRAKGGGPITYLLTNRNLENDRLKDHFDAAHIGAISYSTFEEMLEPAIEELITERLDQPFVEMVVPDSDHPRNRQRIDPNNYFYQRAIANNEQGELKPDCKPSTDQDDILGSKQTNAGASIFEQIRAYLATFAHFQVHNHKLVAALVEVLVQCAGKRGWPGFEKGGPLPANLHREMLNFLYSEDQTKPFDGTRLNLTGTRLKGYEHKLADAIGALREALGNQKVTNYSEPMINSTALSLWLRKHLEKQTDETGFDLHQTFAQSRKAFNGLRQILRSKVLLAMVLNWLLAHYKSDTHMPELAHLRDYARTQAVEDAIKTGKYGLAKPLPRASPEQRKAYRENLERHFKNIILAVGGDTEAEAQLPEEMKALVTQYQNDDDALDALKTIAGLDKKDADTQNAFFSVAKNLMIDTLCPALFLEPNLKKAELINLFNGELVAVYLNAILLTQNNERLLLKIADKHAKSLSKMVNKGSITNPEEHQKAVLQDLINHFFLNKELVKQVKDGLTVIGNAVQLMDAMPEETAAPGATGKPGAGDISTTFSYDLSDDNLLETTPTESARVKEAVKVMVKQSAAMQQKAEESAQEGETKNEPAAAQTAEGPKATQATEAQTDADQTQEDVAAEATSKTDADQEELGETGLLKRVTDLTAQMLANHPETPAEAFPDRVLAEMEKEPDLKASKLARDLRIAEQCFNLIYTRYIANPDKADFRAQVDRMTLMRMMRLFADELRLGQTYSHLYRMIIDLVRYPNPADFMREKSITEYFDDGTFDLGNLEALLKALEIEGLSNIRNFVCELQGMRYLLEKTAEDPDAEIVVINGDAQEFLTWLRTENLDPNENAEGGMRCQSLCAAGTASSFMGPGLVYLTNTAFKDDAEDKKAFLDTLATFPLRRGNFRVVLPPMLLTAPLENWHAQGKELAKKTNQSLAPVTIVGPSPHLNPPTDTMPSHLPAGYLLAAHFLRPQAQNFKLKNINEKGVDRFHVLGVGAAEMRAYLSNVFWGPPEQARFEIDYYGYLTALLAGAAASHGGAQPFQPETLFNFLFIEENPLNGDYFNANTLLDRMLPNGNGRVFGLGENPALPEGQPAYRLETLVAASDHKTPLNINQTTRLSFKNVQWLQKTLPLLLNDEP